MKLCHCGEAAYAKKLCKYHYWLEYRKEQAIKKQNDKQEVKSTKFVSKQPVKRTKIKKLSDKQRVRNAEFKRVKEAQFLNEWIDGGGFIQCEIRVEGCMNNACDPHHPIDRVGDNLLMDCIPACRPCHNWCKEHPKEAEAAGFIVSRIKVNEAL